MNRRALLAGSLAMGMGFVTACSPGVSGQGNAPVPSTSPAPPGTPSLPANPTVTSAVAAVEAQRSFVVAVAAAFPTLAPRCQRLRVLHEAHLRFLLTLPGAAAREPTVSPSTPSTRRLGAKALAASTTLLAEDLAGLALASEDGPLARALASLSAGVTQRAAAMGWRQGDEPLILPHDRPLSGAEQVALQSTLARAHANLWVYAVLGGRTSATKTPLLFAAIQAGSLAYRQQRDQLTDLLTATGAEPVASAPTYPQPLPLDNAQQIARAARTLEHDGAAASSWLVSQTRDEVRSWAMAALTNAAIRELVVQGTPENFPGADEFADR